MNPRLSRLALPALAAGTLLVAIFAVMVVRFRAELRAEIRQTIIDRQAAVLRPVALRQLAQREAALAGQPAGRPTCSPRCWRARNRRTCWPW